MFYCKSCRLCYAIRVYEDIITMKYRNEDVKFERLYEEDRHIKPCMLFQNDCFYKITNKDGKELKTKIEDEEKIKRFIEIVKKYPCKRFFEKQILDNE